MENHEKIASVPLYIYEKEKDREERRDKRKNWIIILLIILLFASHVIWLGVFNQYDRVSYSQDGQGINNVNLGDQGDVFNEPESSDSTQEKAPN